MRGGGGGGGGGGNARVAGCAADTEAAESRVAGLGCFKLEQRLRSYIFSTGWLLLAARW